MQTNKAMKMLVGLTFVLLVFAGIRFFVDEQKARSSRLEAAGVSVGHSIVTNLEWYFKANGRFPEDIHEAIGAREHFGKSSWVIDYQASKDSLGFSLRLFVKGKNVPCFEADHQK